MLVFVFKIKLAFPSHVHLNRAAICYMWSSAVHDFTAIFIHEHCKKNIILFNIIDTCVSPYRQKLSNLIVFPSWYFRRLPLYLWPLFFILRYLYSFSFFRQYSAHLDSRYLRGWQEKLPKFSESSWHFASFHAQFSACLKAALLFFFWWMS